MDWTNFVEGVVIGLAGGVAVKAVVFDMRRTKTVNRSSSDRRRTSATQELQVRAMGQKTFPIVAGAVFAIVALLHLLRIFAGWPVLIGSWAAPMWLSWIAVIVAGGLSCFGLSLAARRSRR